MEEMLPYKIIVSDRARQYWRVIRNKMVLQILLPVTMQLQV